MGGDSQPHHSDTATVKYRLLTQYLPGEGGLEKNYDLWDQQLHTDPGLWFVIVAGVTVSVRYRSDMIAALSAGKVVGESYQKPVAE